jgi:hypothetical protein
MEYDNNHFIIASRAYSLHAVPQVHSNNNFVSPYNHNQHYI